MDHEEAAKVNNARTLAKATGATAEEAEEMLRGIEGGSEALFRSIDPDPVGMAERRKRHEVVGVALNGAVETAEFRWGDVKQCPSCESTDIERQTADEGRPFSCNNCGLEFFRDTR